MYKSNYYFSFSFHAAFTKISPHEEEVFNWQNVLVFFQIVALLEDGCN